MHIYMYIYIYIYICIYIKTFKERFTYWSNLPADQIPADILFCVNGVQKRYGSCPRNNCWLSERDLSHSPQYE